MKNFREYFAYIKKNAGQSVRKVSGQAGRWLPSFLFLGAMFFAGGAVGEAVSLGSADPGGAVLGSAAIGELVSGITLAGENWGLGFGDAGTQPTGNETVEELAEYNAYFLGSGEEKKIYLTFDCGYENGNTAPILDALKEHNAPATFFVVGHYLESAPDLVKRMVAEGHTVGNHSYHHPDMTALTDLKDFREELDLAAVLFKEVTGDEMAMYYRPPQGKYNKANLEMAKELGYSTFFWSLAYVDWQKDSQPDPEASIEKLCSRIHPGAVVLLHTTSETNGKIMDELLGRWEEMGYSFGPLEELVRER